MCGIVGYIGRRPALSILVGGLQQLSYRGYDSAGVALLKSNGGGLWIAKEQGKVDQLTPHLTSAPHGATVGIAHTRWATHGVPNQVNAHPHTDESGEFAIVHNGIIDNFAEIRAELEGKGVTFRTETDTEVLVQLIASIARSERYCLEKAVRQALARVDGTYGVLVVSAREPDVIVAARQGSPIIIGVGDNETVIASSAAAIVAHTRQAVELEDGEMIVVRREGFTARRSIEHIDLDPEQISKGGFETFMRKEIAEQPTALRATMRGRIVSDQATTRLGGFNLHTPESMREIRRIKLLGCGTSWHAALVGEMMLESIARTPTETHYASEYRYRDAPNPEPGTLCIAVSQSGETADTLAAVQEARRRGAEIAGIVNVVGSLIARETRRGTYLHAGSEMGVASTKAFTCQLTAFALLAVMLGRGRGVMSEEAGYRAIHALQELPEQMERVFETESIVRRIAESFCDRTNALYLGRGYNFPVALEGALKLKEISYVHAEGYPAAEMKHGPIALIDANMPVVVVAPQDHNGIYRRVLGNIREVQTRGGRIIVIATEGDADIAGVAEKVVYIPRTLDFLTPILAVVPLQLLAYHIAVMRGCDVDHPRNLAKSVTVE